MKTLSIALVVATGATLCTAQAQQKPGYPTKRDLAQQVPALVQLPPTAPAAGGSDDCANAGTADAISGAGTFAVNTVGSTHSIETFGTCVNPQLDVWFEWTATGNDQVTVSFCTLATADTVLAVYSGAGCPAANPLVCNDDSCALQSQLTFVSANAGDKFMIRCGAFGAATTYTGSMAITLAPVPPPAPVDDCSLPQVLPGPGTYAFDTSTATTGTQGQAEASCLYFTYTGIANDLWYTYVGTTNGTATVTTCLGTLASPSSDSKIAIYSGAGCPTAAAIACIDDSACVGGSGLTTTISFPTVCGQAYTIQLGKYPLAGVVQGTFTVSEVGASCAPAPVGFCFGDDSGTQCPCSTNPPVSGTVPPGTAGNGCPNSLFPQGANLAASGSSQVSADTLVLNGSNMPNSSALYFQGNAKINAGNGSVFGDGLRCITTGVIRLKTVTNAANVSSYPGGGDPSVSVKGMVAVAGGTKYYQIWYRNSALFCVAAQTFNLSNGLDVTWVP